MEFLAFHIYHLDDGEEADQIIDLLQSSGVGSEWTIERPSDETNAIFICVDIETGTLEIWEIRQRKLDRALSLLSVLNKEAIDWIKARDLRVAMRIHTSEFYLPLPDTFVHACGRLGLEICILNAED